MKKLNHPNLIKLHEVIDDDRAEQLYMGQFERKKTFLLKIIFLKDSLRICSRGSNRYMGSN